ncbi:MAG: ribonuclease R [Proteobacteria bacterium]|nr:ribonuclease R [Pseudomonadota bacterium]MBU1737883.1 ribonuclease R [Pseudomonadota bacterium]
MARRTRSRRTPAGQRRKPARRPDSRPQGGSRPRHSRSAAGDQHLHLEDSIIGFLYSAGGSSDLKGIAAGLAIDSRTKIRELDQNLQALCREKTLSYKGKDFHLPRNNELLEATLTVNPRGFGFATPVDDEAAASKKRPEARNDIFIPARDLASAGHGDRVLVRLSRVVKENREGRVIRILGRSAKHIVGIFHAGKTVSHVVPEDARYTFKVMIKAGEAGQAKEGQAVVAAITSYPAGDRNPEGRVLEVLGDPGAAGVQAKIVILAHDLPHIFPAEALAQADALEAAVTVDHGRSDLRDILHVTIDGETARDFDDAVAIRKNGKNFLLYVSIADVSHYVTPGSPLDLEAYKRGTSVYFPDQVVPMLPERLSNDLCSLVPEQDRFAFTAIMEFDRNGKRLSEKFAKSVIRSHKRFTYTIVNKIVVDKDPASVAEHQRFVPDLTVMAELAAILEQKRVKRGSIGFEIPEPVVVIADNKVKAIVRSKRLLAHKLIEEFMLAANEAVAETFTRAKRTNDPEILYRIHEKPDPLKVEDFFTFAAQLGISLPKGDPTPATFAAIVSSVRDTPREYLINNLLLRTMQQARYNPENVGHFGLAATDYTHFTSPIRRYPDLMVHRALARISGIKSGAPGSRPPYASADDAGMFLSGRERVAVDAEREAVERLQARYMLERIGEEFDGIISGVASFGLFVELLETFISGAIDITDMTEDHYDLDEKNHRFIGRIYGRIIQIGEQVRVKVKSVDVNRRRINFTLVS